jgi:hypothetical protein
MKKRRRIFLIVGVVIMAALVVKAILFFTAKPKITVDYVAEYNRISRPENYDPNENAAPYYQKAYDAFVEMPKELRNPYINWPADFNNIEKDILENWIVSNKQAFEYFRTASNKLYFWSEKNAAEDSHMMTVLFPELISLRNLAVGITWDAKINIIEKRYKEGLDDILACYRAGNNVCGGHAFMVEQSQGLGIKQKALATGFEILNRMHIDSSNLREFQNELETEILEDKYVPGFEAEKLLCYDELQRSFVYNGKGTGRLAWRKVKNFLTLCGKEYNIRVVLSCFVGPTENDMVNHIEKTFASFEPIRTETPWQLHTRDPSYFDRIYIACEEDFFLGLLVPNPSRIFQSYHQTKAQEQALLATTAILRFKEDNQRFPTSLDELVGTDYLKSLPMDPYSDDPLVYKPGKDNFTLYSVGKDFVDDGGSNEPKTKEVSGFKGTYITSCGYPLDIVYWPVRELKRPHKELAVAAGCPRVGNQ